MFANAFQCGLELAVAIDGHDLVGFGCAHDFGESGEEAADARLGEGARAVEFDDEELVHFAVPVAFGPAAEVVAAHESGLIVIGAEVGCAGVRDVDRDEWNVGLEVFSGDVGGDDLIGLKFDGEVDFLADEVIGAAQGDLGLVAVVDGDEFDLFALGGALEAAGNFAIKGGVLALCRVADAVEAAAAHFGGEAVAVFADAVEKTALVERVEQAETHALVEASAGDDVAKAQDFAGGLEGLEHTRGVDERFYHVAAVIGALGGIHARFPL